MPTKRLTRRNLESLKREALESGLSIIAWDDDLAGFGCRLSPKGKASWIVKRRVGAGGRQAKHSWHSFGTLAELSPEAARLQAQELLREIRSGVDLHDRQRKQRLDAQRDKVSGSLREAFDTWHKRNSKPGLYWSEIKRLGDVEIIPALGDTTLVKNITRSDVRNLIERKADTSPGVARSMFACIRPFFKWCVERELIDVSPLDGLSAPKPLDARDRVLTDDEIKLVWNASSTVGSPYGIIYQLLLLTAQRRDEVAGLRWDELNLDKGDGAAGGTWIIPSSRTKNSREHLVHLSPLAIDILKTVKPVKDCPFVFPSSEGTSVSGFSKAKTKLDSVVSKANEGKALPDWRIHDLRRTAATGMASLKVPPHIVERVLNHVSGSTGGIVGVYQRFEYAEERKKAILAWSNYISALVSPSQINANVISIR